MKKILVTGGAGFLGSHLIDRLLDRGDQVICTDNLYTGNIKNVDHHDGSSDFQFLEHDVIDPLDVEIDQIYNLACPASPVHYQSDPINTTKTNVIGALNMLELAKRNNAKIFQASTSEVYGDPTVHPQVESYWGNVNPVGVRSCYDEGKRCAETLFFDYYRQYNIKIRVGRIFNTYGPRMQLNDGRVVSNFIIQALKGEDLTIYGDGSQTRSFCYVDDLIEGFIRFMDIDNNGETGSSFTGPINLGNPIEFTVLELAEKILTIVGGESKLSFQPLPSDDPTQRKPDINIANKYLENWNPNVSLELGLTKTVEYFDKLLIKD